MGFGFRMAIGLGSAALAAACLHGQAVAQSRPSGPSAENAAPAPEGPRRRRQMPGGAVAPFFTLPDAALPFAPQSGAAGAFAVPNIGAANARPDTPSDHTPVAFDARYGQGGPMVRDALHWRVFAARPEINGAFALIAESRDAAPVFALRPGAYIVHTAFGMVSLARRVEIGSDPFRETIILNAGALRLSAKVGEREIAPSRLAFDIFAGGLFDGGEPRLVMRQAQAGDLITLPEGTYHVVSAFGDANATVRADVRVRAGRVTEATVHHRAATVALKLVRGRSGGDPLGNTAWTVLTPGGDVIKESIGAFPNMVLQEGEYLAIARNEGRVFNRRFQVEAGKDLDIEVIAR